MLYVEPGSPVVEVQTLWELFMNGILVSRGDRVIAGARGGGPWSGNLDLVMRGEQPGGPAPGAAVPVAAGDTLLMELGAHEAMVTTVAPLDASVDPETLRVTGRAAPGARVGLARPESPLTSTLVTAGPDGAFTLDAGPIFAGGNALGAETFEVYTTGADGHNTRKRFIGAAMTTPLGGWTVTGRAMPGGEVRVVRRLPDGQRLTAGTNADVTGRFTATFATGEASIAPGETVTLEANGITSTLTLVPITAELAGAGELLRGTGPPDALLEIAIHVGASEIPDRHSAFVGGDGRWAIDLHDPVRGISVTDLGLIRRIEITHRDGPGAEVFALEP